MNLHLAAQLSCILFFAVIGLIYVKKHFTESDAFDFNKLFSDPLTARLNIAFAVTTFILLYYTLQDHLSEWLYGGYIGAWVADKVLTKPGAGSG